MSINISFDGSNVEVKSQFDNYNKPATLDKNEQKAVNYIKDEFLKRGLDFKEIQFRRSRSYLTLLVYNNFDFCRINVGTKSV